MATTHDKLTITAVTEVECCQARTQEPGHLAIGSLQCPHCGREAWMAQGYLMEHAAGACHFVPVRRAVRHLMRFPYVGVTRPTLDEAHTLLQAAA